MKSEARAYYDRKLQAFPDSPKRLFKRAIPSDKEHIKKIHLTGICGTAMGSLASLLKDAGYEISGSDTECYPPMSDFIQNLGIQFMEGFKASNIKEADVIIIGNVCGPDNPEAKAARESRKPTLSVGEAIHFFFLDGKKSLVVSGTHGKTTTTGLLAHILSKGGFDPGFMIGGVIQSNSPSLHNSKLGKGEYFAIEGDEYDTAYFDKAPKFLHYDPFISIITSLEFDHADIYENFEKYMDAFRFLVAEVSPDGALFICGDEDNLRLLGKEAEAEVFYYGLGERNDISARSIQITDHGQSFELIFKGESLGEFETTLFGKHNLLNTLAVCGVAIRIGLSIERLRDGLKSFPGMKRRQEVVYDKEITILDDFAHHPTAVMETISAIRSKYEGRRLVVFFEPRSVTSRKKIFEEAYGTSFDDADLVFLSTPELKPVDNKNDFIDPSHVVLMVKERGTEAYCFKNAEELLADAKQKIVLGDVVLIMSNGAFDGIHHKLADSFSI